MPDRICHSDSIVPLSDTVKSTGAAHVRSDHQKMQMPPKYCIYIPSVVQYTGKDILHERRMPNAMEQPMNSRFLVLIIAAGFSLHGWGPHSEITKAALDVIGVDAPLVRMLGAEAAALTRHCWMPDIWMQYAGEYYVDDYLFTTRRPTHLGTSHAFRISEGKYGAYTFEMFDIYFRRALQALRTETPVNAARWTGSLTHFTEDTGAPPHAIDESSALHGPMEQWVEPKDVGIQGYVPTMLGADDETALKNFWQVQERLHQYSIERALKIKPLAAAGDRAAAEPLVLACANESARNAADLYATLGALASMGPKGAGLRGTVRGISVSGMLARMCAKVMLAGTDYSTLCAPDGTFEFRNIPPGTYTIHASRPGNEVFTGTITIPGAGPVCDISLAPSRVKGNLLRNPALSLHWASMDAPDMWYVRRGVWRSEALPIVSGKPYLMEIAWKKPGASVTLRWASYEREDGGKYTNERTIMHPERTVLGTAPSGMKFAYLIVSGGKPDESFEYTSFSEHAGDIAPTTPAKETTVQAAEGLALYYSFDEGAGDSVKDQSGGGNSASVAGLQFKPGRSGSALVFSKTPFECGKAGAISGELTITAWVQFNDLPAVTKQRADIAARQDGNKNGYCFGVEGGSLGFIYRGSGTWAYAGLSPVKNTWYHLAVAVNAEKTSFYVNGTLKGTAPGQTGLASDAPLKIGERLSGILDEVRIYSRALSADEISALASK